MSRQDRPPQRGTSVTGGGTALGTALAYHQAWTSQDAC